LCLCKTPVTRASDKQTTSCIDPQLLTAAGTAARPGAPCVAATGCPCQGRLPSLCPSSRQDQLFPPATRHKRTRWKDGSWRGCFWPGPLTQSCGEERVSLPALLAGARQLQLPSSPFAPHSPAMTFSLLTCKVSNFPRAACVHLRRTANPNGGI